MKSIYNTLFILFSLALIISCGKDEPSVSCTDGILNGTETGVDCGGSDCAPCPTCFDNVQNGDETGIDCGGSCSTCSTCNDGVQNGLETGIDCGGPNCPLCSILGCTDSNSHNYNANATVDDGTCETCTDGIQNGDETSIDCGGILCSTCDVLGCTDSNSHNYDPNATVDDGTCETCTDGVQNGDETSIDCGGVLCLPCFTVGQAGPANGVVFYDKGNYNDGWRYMEAGTDIQGTDGYWGCFPFLIDGTSLATGSGLNYTELIIAYHSVNGCSQVPTAALSCDAINSGGYDDWFLPSVNELKEMFPIKDQLGLNSGRYWSSTESNNEDAYVVDFGAVDVSASSYTYYKVPFNGQQGNARIKPIRRF